MPAVNTAMNEQELPAAPAVANQIGIFEKVGGWIEIMHKYVEFSVHVLLYGMFQGSSACVMASRLRQLYEIRYVFVRFPTRENVYNSWLTIAFPLDEVITNLSGRSRNISS